MPDPQVWPLEANFKDTIEELYGYSTEVIVAEDELEEQRIALRVHPTGGIEFSCMAHVLQDAGLIESLLYKHQPNQWLVPLWMLSRVLTADVGPGQTSLSLSTADAPFLDPLNYGTKLLIWESARKYEACPIDTISPTSISLLDPVTLSWAAGVGKVIPCRVGRVEEALPLSWLTTNILIMRVRFRFDADESVLVNSAAIPEGEFIDIGAIIPSA